MITLKITHVHEHVECTGNLSKFQEKKHEKFEIKVPKIIFPFFFEIFFQL